MFYAANSYSLLYETEGGLDAGDGRSRPRQVNASPFTRGITDVQPQGHKHHPSLSYFFKKKETQKSTLNENKSVAREHAMAFSSPVDLAHRPMTRASRRPRALKICL